MIALNILIVIFPENNAANQQLPLSSITNKMPFTPQAADPSKLLRKNLRLKVETQVKINVVRHFDFSSWYHH